MSRERNSVVGGAGAGAGVSAAEAAVVEDESVAISAEKNQLRKLFPDYWGCLQSLHANEKDNAWIKGERQKLFERYYAPTVYSGQTRTRQLCWLVRMGNLDEFLALKPTLQELRTLRDPLMSTMSLISLIVKLQKRWLDSIYHKVVEPYFKLPELERRYYGWRQHKLHWMAVCGQIGAIESEIKQKPRISIDITDDDGETPLFLAARYGQVGVVTLMLDHGVYLNMRSTYEVGHLLSGGGLRGVCSGVTPLFVAAEYGHVAVVELLLRYKGIQVNASAHGVTPLWVAAKNGHLAVVEALLKNEHVDVDAWSEVSYQTALFVAVDCGDSEMVKMLLEHGADVNCEARQGYTPLLMAVEDKQYDMVKLLLAHGANADCVDRQGKTALQLTCTSSSADEIIEAIILSAFERLSVSDREQLSSIAKGVMDAAATDFGEMHSDNVRYCMNIKSQLRKITLAKDLSGERKAAHLRLFDDQVRHIVRGGLERLRDMRRAARDGMFHPVRPVAVVSSDDSQQSRTTLNLTIGR